MHTGLPERLSAMHTGGGAQEEQEQEQEQEQERAGTGEPSGAVDELKHVGGHEVDALRGVARVVHVGEALGNHLHPNVLEV